jgi:hypothetical protein
MHVRKPMHFEYFHRVLDNALICCDDWKVQPPELAILLGQSDSRKGIRNNYEIRASCHRRAYNGWNHKPYGEHGDSGYDDRKLTDAYSFAEIVALMMVCPDYHPRR